MLATIRLDFDPTVRLLGTSVRLETLALAGAVLFALLVAAIGAGRMWAGTDGKHLRRDDLLLIALGAVPGAVVGGRLGYVLIHLDYYRANPNEITDPSTGSAELTLAVVFGVIGAVAVARLLDAPLGRWLHVAAVPTLLLLGLGKLATVLGGGGQGLLVDTNWSTVYLHAGPWESPLANRPAIASQAIEGLLVLAAVLVLIVEPALLRLRLRRWGRIVRPGRAPARRWHVLNGTRRFLLAIALWSVARFMAASTWRDAQVVGQLRAEQVMLVGVFVVSLLGIALMEALDVRRARKARMAAGTPDSKPGTKPDSTTGSKPESTAAVP